MSESLTRAAGLQEQLGIRTAQLTAATAQAAQLQTALAAATRAAEEAAAGLAEAEEDLALALRRATHGEDEVGAVGAEGRGLLAGRRSPLADCWRPVGWRPLVANR